MKFSIAVVALLISGVASAQDAGDRAEQRLDNRGDRIEERLDRKGDRIEERLDERGDRREQGLV